MNKLLGVVLCGGKSRRMGSDKGLLLKNGKSWAQLVADMLTRLGMPIAVSINPSQQEAYQQLFPQTPLLVDTLEIEGPLEGLLTAHKHFPDRDLLLMACDLIDMDEATLGKLIKVYQEEPEFDFYAYQQNGFCQTFCAIYTASGLAGVLRKFENGELKKYSLHDRFNEGKTRYIPLENTPAFNNYNSPFKV